MNTTVIKKVLIALDYDPTAQKVAETSSMVAKSMGAQVVLLHVVSPDSGYYYMGEYSTIMGFSGFMDEDPIQLDSVNGLKIAALRFLEKSKRHLGDETIQTLVSEGDFADAILKASDDIDADLIVIG